MMENENNVSAFVFIKAARKKAEIEESLRNLDEAVEVDYVAGEFTYITKVRSRNNNDLGRLVSEIGAIDGIASAQTFVVLQTLKAEPDADHASVLASELTKGIRKPYMRFLSELVEKGKQRSSLHENMRVYDKPFIRTRGSVLRGLYNYYYSGKTWGRVELFIDRGNKVENKAIFDELYTSRDEIEKVFGQKLKWARLDDKRACRISFKIENGGYSDPNERWGPIQDEMITAMINLEGALRPYLLDIRRRYQ